MAEIDRTQLFGYADIDKIQVELEMLDFEYVEKCSDWKILMKILDVLRSGKEGHFPELMRKTENMLLSVMPAREKKRYMAVFSQPSASEAETAQEDILKWAKSTNAIDSSLRSGEFNDIDEPAWTVEMFKGVLNQVQFSKLKDVEGILQCSTFPNLKRINKAEIERRKGNDFFKAKDYDTAIKYYTNSIAYHPVNESSWTNRAICYIKKDIFDYAEIDCNVALILNPNSVKALVRRGISRLSAGKYRQAALDFLQGSTIEPTNEEIAKLLGKAKEKFEEVEGKPLNLSTSASSSVPVQFIDHKLDLLVPSFPLTRRCSQILRKQENNTSSDQQFIRIEIENTSDSEDESDEFPEINPAVEIEAEKLKEKANVLVQNGSYHEAIALYDLSLGKNWNIPVLNNRAQAKIYVKDFSGAIEDLTTVLSVEKANLKALFRRAKAFYEIGEFNLSMQDINQFLQLDPHHVEAQNFKENLDSKLNKELRSDELKNEGNLYMKDEKYELALQSYSQSICLNPENLNSISNRSLVLLKLSKFEEAEKDASQILSLCLSRTDVSSTQLVRKALYRRALARLELYKRNNLDEESLKNSSVDALELIRLDPKNEQGQKLSAEISEILSLRRSQTSNKSNSVQDQECIPEPAKTFYEFERVWKSLKSSPSQRFRYLVSFKKPQFKKVFKTTLSTDLLSDIIEVYAENSIPTTSVSFKIFSWLLELQSIEFSFMMISSETQATLLVVLKKFSSVEGFEEVNAQIEKMLRIK